MISKEKACITNLQCELVAERSLVNPEEISWLQYDVLLALSQKECILPSELCAGLGVSRVKLAKSLKKLKEQRYVVQSRAKHDGRELETRISAKGIKLLGEISQGHDYLERIIHETMSKEEQKIFVQLADRFSVALRQRRIQNEQGNSYYSCKAE